MEQEHPCAAFGVSPSKGRHQQPGKAGSAVALVGPAPHAADLVNALEN